MKRILLSALLLRIVFTAAAQDAEPAVPGTVSCEGRPVPDVYLVIRETGEFSVSDGAGLFTIAAEAGTWTLTASADGYLPYTLTFTVPLAGKLEVPLERETIDMETVEIVSTREKYPGENRVVSTLTRAALEAIPTAGDPFAAADLENGVVLREAVTDGGYAGTSLTRGPANPSGSCSVFGADGDFNTFYWDYIPIPSSKHLSFDVPLIPLEATGYLEIWKGVAPLEYGPGFGGLFRAVPDTSFDSGSLLVSPGTGRTSVVWKTKFTPRSGLLLSVSKSLTELTVTPLLWSFKYLYDALGIPAFDEPPVSLASWGDLCARYFTSSDAGSLSVDFLGFYDAATITLDMPGTYDATSGLFPAFAALGSRWTTKAAPSLLNTLSAWISLLHQKNHADQDMDLESYARALAEKMGEDPDDLAAAMEEYGHGYARMDETFDMDILSAGVSEELAYVLSDSLVLRAGFCGRISNLDGSYSGTTDMDMELYGFRLTEKHDVGAVGHTETLARLHGYLGSDLTFGRADARLGTGLTWYPFHETWAPELTGEVSWTGDTSVSIRAGWSEASFDDRTYLARRLSEAVAGTTLETSLSHLPRSISVSSKIRRGTGTASWFVVEPYAAWYYDLSGLALYASWRDPYEGTAGGDGVLETRMLDPDTGFSAGLGAGLQGKAKAASFDLRYIPAVTMYHRRGAGGDGWFYPNGDVRHTLKAVCTGGIGKKNTVSGSIALYVDKPFTPERVVDGSGTLEKESFNSARDLVPRFALGVKWERDSSFFRRTGRWSLDCRNLLAVFNPELVGMKKAGTKTDGASTRAFRHREYSFFRTDLLEIVTAMDIRMGGQYSF